MIKIDFLRGLNRVFGVDFENSLPGLRFGVKLWEKVAKTPQDSIDEQVFLQWFYIREAR